MRRRLCRPSDLSAELSLRPRLPGRAALAELVQLLQDGCRSELEIWGCLRVLDAPGMPAFVQQRPVVVRGERYVLDAAYDEVLLAVEMDGAASLPPTVCADAWRTAGRAGVGALRSRGRHAAGRE